MARPVVVELVGLFPLYYRLCARSLGRLAGTCDLELPDDQLREYPPAVREQGRQLQVLYRQLMGEFGDRVVPVSVPLTSLRGLWLSLRYGIRTGEFVVVVGGRAVPARAGYEAVRAAVAAALAA